MIILVAQLGARMHYAVPEIFHRNKCLGMFCTDIYAGQGWPSILKYFSVKFLPKSIRRLRGRLINFVPKNKIIHFPVFGLSYAYKKSKIRSEEDGAAVHISFGSRFNKKIIDSIIDDIDAVYGFNSASLELFEFAKMNSIKTILEQTIAPRYKERELINLARKKFPTWDDGIEEGPNIQAFCEREVKEWNYADLIICGSNFVKKSIAECGGPIERCVVVPYGVGSKFKINRDKRQPGPLRVLTVGAVGLRKGSPIVMEVAHRLKGKCEFRMVGQINCGADALLELKKEVNVIGAIPRNEILTHYEWADIFFLPSLCEGSATVTYEALIAGLPVICTENTGSVVTHGLNGFIVDVLNSDSAMKAFELFLNNSELLQELSKNAVESSTQCTLEAYEERLMDVIKRIR